jgi:hypothetical protein
MNGCYMTCVVLGIRGCSAGISWHISACLGLFPLTEYYSFYQPMTIHSTSGTPSETVSGKGVDPHLHIVFLQ